MKLPNFGVKRPIATLMIFVAILFLGILSLMLLGIDLFPDISNPYASVITTYQGASAEDVEKKVTEVIEKNVSTVSNVKEVTSVSSEGVSAVTVEFEWGKDLDAGVSDLREALDFASADLPDDVGDPSIFKFDISQMPILFFAISAKYNTKQMRYIVDDQLVQPLKRVPGIGSVQMRGGPIREVRVYFDREKLNDIGLNVYTLAEMIDSQNQNIPAGNIENEKRDVLVRIPEEYESVEELKNLIVANKRGNIVRLKDVATINDDYYQEERYVEVNGKSGMVAMVQKQSGANTVQVIERAKEKMKEIEANLPSDFDVQIVFDNSEFIKDSINNLTKTIFTGGILVILIVLLFLRNIRGSAIIVLIIPFSLIIAFILLYVNGFTINMISLSALAVSIGMVVDNGIVVLENIYRHLEKGEKPNEAAMWGASEVGGAILASSITTAVIFLPIFFINDISAMLFKQLGYAMIIVLAGSLLASLLLIPMLASKFLKRKKIKSKFFNKSEAIFTKIEDIYGKIINWSIWHRKTTIISAVLIFAISIGVLLTSVGTEFMPTSDSGQVQMRVYTPQGTSLEKTKEIGLRLQKKIVDKYRDIIDKYYFIVGTSESNIGAAFGQDEGTNIAELSYQLVKVVNREKSSQEVTEEIRQMVEDTKGVEKISISSEDFFRQMFGGGGSPLRIEVYGYDLDETFELSKLVERRVSEIKGVRNTSISRDMGKPEIQLDFNRERLYQSGLSVGSIGNQVRAQFSGLIASKYRAEDEEYDIFMRLKDEYKKNISDIKGMYILNKMGNKIPLENLADVELSQGPVEIERKDQNRVIYVTANTYGRSFGEVASEVRDVLNRIEKPKGTDLVLTGQAKDQAKSFRLLALAVLAGIVLVYMVMASQFESLKDPFIIMFSIPFAFSGVFFILAITGVDLSIIVFIGMILLVGMVVNNAIVLIDYINLLRKRDYKLVDAILTACKQRLRPVLMTALTTMFGMLPLALSSGEGAESWIPLGISVIGGLFFSTFVTLILIPTIYMIIERKNAAERGELK
ncbi:MAG: efflux RND transporter permease subunit [Candidatus Mcinerneyibacterium aminivorans]|uniref:Efflux RND transporter permease subunit n=1 Tax=Candidatus Mcinerneyibacterium aminivorans TaxID=2703815 RepID=A0A5D0MHC1_9BACT|nr:MAG: efflux RND transporter permease subunit [Candidatus Mcinerneyibacterium aminivorans]